MNSGAQRDYKAGNVFTHSVLDALSQGDRNGGCRRLCAQRSEISRKHSPQQTKRIAADKQSRNGVLEYEQENMQQEDNSDNLDEDR